MSAPNSDSSMQQLVPIAPPGKASGGDSVKELVVVGPAKSSGGVKLQEDEEDLEVKIRRIMENVPVRISNTSGSSAGFGSGDCHQHRQMRRREQDRIARMYADYQKRKEMAKFELEEWLKAAEERTAKKRLKRQKKKQRKKEKRAKTGNNGGEEPNRLEPSEMMMKVQMTMTSLSNDTLISFEFYGYLGNELTPASCNRPNRVLRL